MLLTVDIGNTNILIGIFENDELVFEARLASDSARSSEQYALEIAGICQLKSVMLKNVSGAVISSVVPVLTNRIKEAVALLTDCTPIVLGPGIKTGLPIKIDNPAQLGADLVAGAVGAVNKYSLPCLIIDLGTATKVSVIDSEGTYRGCSISAGIGISLKALSGSAALLPSINLQNPDCAAFGTNTVASMQAGIIVGTAAMIDGLCDRIEKELDENVRSFVITGGYAGYISGYCAHNMQDDPHLILDGLRYIYQKNSAK